MTEVYIVRTQCLNCKHAFIYNSNVPYEFRNAYSHDKIKIPLGTKISSVKCPICGCKTLIGIGTDGVK